MRLVFFGTPDVAAIALRALLGSGHDVAAVVTQPDRARGRGRGVTPSPVKEVALEHGRPVLQPASPKEPGFADALASFAPDVLAVVAYGHILPRDVLNVARAVNVHFSLLPRYRGAAPVQRALMDGARETGVSVFLLEPTIDTGPVLATERVEISPEETAGDLLDRLAPIGARVLIETLTRLESGTAEPVPQNDADASPAPKIRPEEAEIDWSLPSATIVDRIRGLSPRPGAHTTFRGKRLGIGRARSEGGAGTPGDILDPRSLTIAAGSGAIVAIEVTPEGKRPMPGEDFARGARIQPGERVGTHEETD